MGYFDNIADAHENYRTGGRGAVNPHPSAAQRAASEKRGAKPGGLVGGFLSLFGDRSGLSGLQGDMWDGGPNLLERAGEDWRTSRESIQRWGENVLYGDPNWFENQRNFQAESAGDPRNVSPSSTTIARAELAARNSFAQIEDLKVLQEENLTPEGQQILERFIEMKEKELAEKNQQIANIELQGRAHQRALNQQIESAFPEGLIPGGDPEAMKQLDSLLDSVVEGGSAGTASNLDALMDSIIESNLPDSEKAERLGLIADQAEMRKELQTAMDGLVTDRTIIEETLALPHAELLGDPSLFAQPKLNVDVQYDEYGRRQMAVVEEVESVLEQAYGATIPPDVMRMFLAEDGESGILDMVVNGVLDPNSEQFVQLVSQQAPMVGVPQLQSAINQGLQVAAIREEAFAGSLDQTQYTPGSMELIYALFQAALGAGYDAQIAAQIAEDRNIHHVIDVYSGGRVGATGSGNRAGLGMLTPEAYKRVGFDFDRDVGDPVAELEALILYMMEAGENPAIRMQTFFETGVWGN